MATKRFWLVKSEADAYSIEDLERDGTTPWDGVRNYQARNFMRDEMRPGDRILYYHSGANPPGVVGIAEVASEPYADPGQFDPGSRYHDPKATREDPRWILVDVRFVERFPRLVSLEEIRGRTELAEMVLVKRPRLSVQPVTAKEFRTIERMARGDGD